MDTVCETKVFKDARTRKQVTREHKLALIIGFAVVLVVGVLISDHFSQAGRETRYGEMASSGGEKARPVFELKDPLAGEMPVRQAGPVTAENSNANAQESRTVAQRNADSRATDQKDSREPELFYSLNQSPATRQGSMGTQRGGTEQKLASWGTDRLNPGTALAQTGKTRNPNVKNSTSLQNRNAQQTGRTLVHHVRKGETLTSIARQYYGDGSLWHQLYLANKDRVPDRNRLNVGLALRIPAFKSAGKAIQPVKPAAQPSQQRNRPGRGSSSQPTRYATYTVKKGDTLGEIAQRLLGSSRKLTDLISLNKSVISDADEIYVGLKLRVPAD